MPYWAGQIGSFNKQHIYKHFSMLIRADRAKPKWKRMNFSEAELEARMVETLVPCYSLPNLLRAFGISKVGFLLIDTEGLDCKIMAAQHWSSAQWCKRRPRSVVFEHKHCDKGAWANATMNLRHHSFCPAGGGAQAAASQRAGAGDRYSLIKGDSENEFWALTYER